MSEEEIRNAVVKFDREDLLYGNYEIDIDTPIEVFLTIKQMSKFIKQQNQLQQKENIIKEVREKIESVQMLGLRSGKTLIATLLNDILEILDKEVN